MGNLYAHEEHPIFRSKSDVCRINGVLFEIISDTIKFGVSSRFILRGSLCTPHSEQILQKSSRFAQITQFFPEKVQEGKDYKLNRLFVKNIYKN